MTDEIKKIPDGFKVVPSFPRYAVSKNGEVYSLISSRQLKPWISKGYPCVDLWVDEKTKLKRRVHLLVAEAYIGARKRGLVVCHNDGNRKNNNLSNLRFDTQGGNLKDTIKHKTSRAGSKCYFAKLTEKQVVEIRRIGKLGRRGVKNSGNVKELSATYKVTGGTIRLIIRGKLWANVELEAAMKVDEP